MNIASQYKSAGLRSDSKRPAPSAATEPLTKKQAQKLTNRIRLGVEQLWYLLLDAHDGQAWKALGYSSWEAYVKAEFGMGRSRSYQLLDQGRAIEAIRQATGDLSTNVDISESQARDIKDDLPAVTAEIKQRVDAGEEPAEAVKETVDAAREAKAKAKEEKKAKQAENDALRDQTRENLPPAVKASEEAKRRAIEANRSKKAEATGEDDGLSPEDRIAELEEAVRVLEQDNADLKAENKLYGEMKVQFAQGGFDKVVAGKDEEIRVLEGRLYRESADKASWMKSAKFWEAEAKKLGYSRDEVIDIETGEVVSD